MPSEASKSTGVHVPSAATSTRIGDTCSEAAVAIEGVKAGRIVCFGVSLRDLATEGLVVLCESEELESIWPDIAARMRKAVPAKLDVDLVDARVVPIGTLRKSTSGKLARDGNRNWYLAGKFGPIAENILRDVGTVASRVA